MPNLREKILEAEGELRAIQVKFGLFIDGGMDRVGKG